MFLSTFLGTVFTCYFASVAMPTVSFAYAISGKFPTVNQPAIEFTLPTKTGDGEISLSDFRSEWVVLYFYPKNFTVGYTLEARRFQQDLLKYEAFYGLGI